MPGGAPNVAVRRGGASQDASSAASGVRIGRLPSIGAAPNAGEDSAPVQDALVGDPDAPDAPDAQASDAELPAYRRHAAPVQIAQDASTIGVVLIESAGAEAALRDFPLRVTLALDPFDADGPRRAAAYRAAGYEIALLALGIPELATPSDIAVTLQVWMREYPQVVALMDVPFDGISTRRAVARDLAQMLALDGYGVIALRGTLDAFRQAAQDAGLASASVYRMLDDGRQSAGTIRRLIDRAGFEAQRSDGVLIVGSAANGDTLAALEGFVRTDNRGIALVPASVVLAVE